MSSHHQLKLDRHDCQAVLTIEAKQSSAVLAATGQNAGHSDRFMANCRDEFDQAASTDRPTNGFESGPEPHGHRLAAALLAADDMDIRHSQLFFPLQGSPRLSWMLRLSVDDLIRFVLSSG
jgi:hypothetical protein